MSRRFANSFSSLIVLDTFSSYVTALVGQSTFFNSELSCDTSSALLRAGKHLPLAQCSQLWHPRQTALAQLLQRIMQSSHCTTSHVVHFPLQLFRISSPKTPLHVPHLHSTCTTPVSSSGSPLCSTNAFCHAAPMVALTPEDHHCILTHFVGITKFNFCTPQPHGQARTTHRCTKCKWSTKTSCTFCFAQKLQESISRTMNGKKRKKLGHRRPDLSKPKAHLSFSSSCTHIHTHAGEKNRVGIPLHEHEQKNGLTFQENTLARKKKRCHEKNSGSEVTVGATTTRYLSKKPQNLKQLRGGKCTTMLSRDLTIGYVLTLTNT